ncbi:Soluble inorganic pyrophosphatase 1, chloroplastic [Triticum urartu]|uniref:inorganic diphosphatase n=1 Tax=Triticum urartu TaxID=4572 RepID=M7Z1P1_TRIUA|nr:Soluble inorganic pyrophosphatase 1, chloroplastic [Triticum urartu]
MEVATDEAYTPIKQDTKKGNLRYYPIKRVVVVSSQMFTVFFAFMAETMELLIVIVRNRKWQYEDKHMIFDCHCRFFILANLAPTDGSVVVLYLKGINHPLSSNWFSLSRPGFDPLTCQSASQYNINWNYGLLPQTWEDPTAANADVEGALGDNDPVDVVEIGERRANIGDVLRVKPLAALAMIDEGELDWKIVAISLDDPKASLVNDVDDVEEHFPGTLTAIRDWFRDYKIPDGKPANRFGLGNKPTSKEYALKVIEETNESWEKLVKRKIPAGELSLA